MMASSMRRTKRPGTAGKGRCKTYRCLRLFPVVSGPFELPRTLAAVIRASSPLGDALRREVLEARVLLVEEQVHDPRGPVSLFADDDLGFALERVAVLVHRAVVHLLAVQEHDEVRVLLDGARFAQIRELRPLV